MLTTGPAVPVRLTGANRLRDVLNGSALPAILAFIAGIAGLIGFGLAKAFRPAITCGTVATVASLILLGHGLSVKRVVARSPEECWADLPELELDDSET